MAKWRVYNRHPEGLTHREKFKENLMVIPAGEYIVMDYEDAVQFKGQYFPMKKNAQGAPDPTGFKVIELAPHTTADETDDAPVFICHLDGKKFPTQAALDQYVAANYSDRVFKDEKLDEEIAKAAATKRGAGRPPKEKTL